MKFNTCKTPLYKMHKAITGSAPKKQTFGLSLKVLLATLLMVKAVWFTAEATPVFHAISAANISVQQNDTNNNATSVTLTMPVSINDFRVVNNTLTSRADYFVQIGASATDDVTNGILMSSITDNGRDNGEGNGTNWGTPGIDSNTSATPGSSGQWWIPVFGTVDDTNYPEYNFDVAGAYFPYSNGWYGGWIVNVGGTNNGVVTNIAADKFIGNTNMILGTDVIPNGGGKVTVDLRRFGFDSRSNAIMLCVGGKNEENFADSQPNADGTWFVTCRDDASGSGEADPVAFVCVPMSNHMIVAGRFMGDGSIAMQNSPFTVTTTVGGVYHLTIPGVVPGHGVLIISGEEGGSVNGDNIVSYQASSNGWDIQTRDVGAGNARPNLQALPAGDAVASFVYIPAPTAGFTVTPTNGLATTENGGTATFSVVLDAPPAAEVDILLSASDPTAGSPSVSSLAFLPNNWNISQTVTVTGLNNSSSTVESYSINFSTATSTDTNYNGLQAASVALFNVPNGAPGIFLVPTNGLVTTSAGGTATFQVLVNLPPSDDVVIGFLSSDTTQGTVSPSSVTITAENWTTPQVVTITGVDDGIVNGNINYQIIGAAAVSGDPNYSGKPVGNVSVQNIDNDVAGVGFSVGNKVSVTEGGTTNFTVVLTAKPVANVTLNLASDDTADGTISPASLTFTPANYNVPQGITLNGINNSAINSNAVYNITTTVSSSALGYSSLVVTNVVATTIKAIGLPLGTIVYGLGMPPLGVDGLATANQAIDFSSATLTFTLTANASTNDVLGMRNDGTAAGLIGVSGSTITYGGSTIGSFTGGHGTPLVATIQSGAPAAGVQGLLEAVVFSTTTTNNFATRALSVTLHYGTSGTSTVSKGIRVGQLRITQYQDGADYGYGVYNSEADIEISQAAPGVAYPSGSNPANGLFVQLNSSSSDHQVLLRFDNLIGTGPNQIPPGSIIVSADLNVNILNSGDGFALNRMLIPWDATNATWNSFSDQFGDSGVGVYADDFTAKSNSFSQLGMYVESTGPNNSTIFTTTTTGGGNVTIGVTPDVQAWANGDTNYGWVCDGEGVLDAAGNQPWNNLTDGTGFSPSEDTTVANRPRLRVYWLPAGTQGTSFRFGDSNGYTGVLDCTINQATPTASTPHGIIGFVDAADLGQLDQVEVLIQFTNIFGSAANQIPPGAHIEVAMLNLSSQNSSAAVGDGGRFFALYQPWQDTTTTWNSWSTNGILNDGVQAAVNPTATAGVPALVPNIQGGFHSFEVTPDVQNWSSGTLANNGWGLVPWVGGSDGWGVDLSESTNLVNRPQLLVYYTLVSGFVAQPRLLLPLSVSPLQVHGMFTGTIGTTYTVSRSSSPKGSWSSIGTATVGGGGTATFTDNSPLPGVAFYRVSYP